LDSLSGSANTCNALCNNTPITLCLDGDGCCPSDCAAGDDSDCTGSVDPNSVVTITSDCLTRSTSAQAAVAVTLVDSNGGALSGALVTMSSTAGDLSSVQSSGNLYWAILTPPSSGSLAQISVSADGVSLNTTATVTFAAPFTDLGGGMGGCPADGNARIRVVTPSGAPLGGALVMVGDAHASSSLEGSFNQAPDSDNIGSTSPAGFVEFHDYGPNLDGGITVTAVISGRTYVTFVDGDASDFVIPLAQIDPLVQRGVYTGDITGFNAPSNSPIELAVQFPEIDLEDFVGFSLDTLLAGNECYAAGGLAGDANVPGNIYIPQQCAASFIFCLQNLPEHPYTSAPISFGQERLLGLSGTAPLSALTSGDISGAVSQITFTKIGMQSVNVSAAGPTTQDIEVTTNLIDDVSCTVNNAPPSSDVFCLTAGDWESQANGLTPGAGSLFLSGFKTVDTETTSLPATLNNITRVPNSGSPWNTTDRVSAAAAMYLTDTKGGIVPGTADGVTIVAKRENVGTNLSFTDFIPLRTHSRDGRNYTLSPLPGSNHPPAHSVRITIRRTITETYSSCAAGDSTRTEEQPLWTVYMRGDSNAFTLPTPPASWPAGSLSGELTGLVDVGSTPEDDVIEWKSMTVHEGLNPTYNFDGMLIRTFRESATHVSSNTVGH
jgi:hypothetical protein